MIEGENYLEAIAKAYNVEPPNILSKEEEMEEGVLEESPELPEDTEGRLADIEATTIRKIDIEKVKEAMSRLQKRNSKELISAIFASNKPMWEQSPHYYYALMWVAKHRWYGDKK